MNHRDTNRRVAKALGYSGYDCDCQPAENAYSPVDGTCTRCGQKVAPDFTHSAELALAAANAIGLFDQKKHGCTYYHDGEKHTVGTFDEDTRRDMHVSADSFTTAVCAAVLAICE